MTSSAAIYLDWNATAPIRAEVIAAVTHTMAAVGNASSIHGAGRAARSLVEDARQKVADLVGVKARQVIFTSGATEANNQVLKGYNGKTVLISAIEHASLFETSQAVEHIPVTASGVIDLAWLENRLQQNDAKPALIATMLVNNETGVIQPVRAVAQLAGQHGIPVLCDAVQAAGKIPLDFASLGATFLTLSAHKLGGPQGVGAIIMASGQNPPRLLEGGGQERRQRAGTENVAGIVGFGVAAVLALDELGAYAKTIAPLRDALETALLRITPDLVVYGRDAARVANTSCVSLAGLPAETLLMNFDLAGICISSGSACSSGTIKASHVLSAMGANDASARAALRFSLGRTTTSADIDKTIAAWQSMTGRMIASRQQEIV